MLRGSRLRAAGRARVPVAERDARLDRSSPLRTSDRLGSGGFRVERARPLASIARWSRNGANRPSQVAQPRVRWRARIGRVGHGHASPRAGSC